ncbi:RNA-binding protein 48 isoform X2 [Periplaneta americana]|uniref:RNA-binding protein 48 isoform X2 n=1 Tax=Periplaneta americana TaxID=6978 RepID=UPI0037E8DDBB
MEVYTVNSESQHILVCGVPSLGLQDEVRRLCARFGDVRSLVFVPKYAEEEFTDVYHVQYSRIQSARYAKRHLDGRSFYGGILHVCYAPEMESVAETRAKLIQRRKDVASRTRGDSSNIPTQSQDNNTNQVRQYHRRKKHPALPLTEERLAQASSSSDVNCIWQGIPCEIDPRTITPAPELIENTRVYGPQRPDDGWALAGVRERKIIPGVRHTSQSEDASKKVTLNVYSSSASQSTKNSASIFRFIPRQVSAKSRIVFRDKSDGSRNATDDKSSEKRSSDQIDNISESLDASIMEVRKKIRAVSVPNVQIILERKDPLAASTSGLPNGFATSANDEVK